VGLESKYHVSDFGKIQSIPRSWTRSDGMFVNWPGKLLTHSINPQGYHSVTLTSDGRNWYKKVHRLVLEAFVGPCPDDMEGCHKDGDPSNNYLGNLRWDTSSNNTYDQIKIGTHYASSRVRCPRKHRLIEPNLIIHYLKSGRARNCLSCNRARAVNAYRRSRSLEIIDFKVLSDQKYIEVMGSEMATIDPLFLAQMAG